MTQQLLNFLQTKRLSVVSLAGKINPEALQNSLNFFHVNGINPQIMPHAYDEKSREPYLASELKNRLADFYAAWNNSDVIICSRGGYGCSELIANIDWDLLKNHNPIVVGYSDITALHLAMVKFNCGIPVTGMMFLKFPELITNLRNSSSLLQSLNSNDIKHRDLRGKFDVIQAGSLITGNLIVANLTVLSSLCGTPYLPEFKNSTLIIEDINEAPYKIDRLLTQLLQSGILTQLKALIFGEFLNCGHQDELDFVFQKFAPYVNGLVGKNFPFGHGNNVYSLNMRQTYIIS